MTITESFSPKETRVIPISITNSSGRVLSLKEIKLSCGCMRAKVSSDTIAEGSSSQVFIQLRAKNQRGAFAEAAVLVFDDPRFSLMLRMQGMVSGLFVFRPSDHIMSQVKTQNLPLIVDVGIGPGDFSSLPNDVFLESSNDFVSAKLIRNTDNAYELGVVQLIFNELTPMGEVSGEVYVVLPSHGVKMPLRYNLKHIGKLRSKPQVIFIPNNGKPDGKPLGKISLEGFSEAPSVSIIPQYFSKFFKISLLTNDVVELEIVRPNLDKAIAEYGDLYLQVAEVGQVLWIPLFVSPADIE